MILHDEIGFTSGEEAQRPDEQIQRRIIMDMALQECRRLLDEASPDQMTDLQKKLMMEKWIAVMAKYNDRLKDIEKRR